VATVEAQPPPSNVPEAAPAAAEAPADAAAAEEPTAASATEVLDAPAAAGGHPEPEVAPAPESVPEPVQTAADDRRGLAPIEIGAASNGHGDDEPDPGEVRRQIAAASRSFDPDHQIRRAMDAFLGPMGDPRDRH
jgi:hypothetical protein